MHDIILRGKKHNKVKSLRLGIIIVIILGIILAISFKSILKASYLLAALFMVLSVVILATWIKKKISEKIINVTLIIGVFVTSITAIFIGITETLFLVAVISSLIGMVIGIIINKLYHKPLTTNRP